MSAQISDADRAELIGDVRAQMEELSVLVGDLVELSRDAKPQAAPEPVNLGDVVRQAVDRVRRRAPHLKFDIQLQPWYLEGDPATLERAVTNLLDNAAKWSPEEGTVTVRLSDGLLQVADQGPGIAEEDLPHVFERFYRSTEARTMPGSGLGLAIVRQAAENHGGRVAAARAPSGGALLGLWLPGSPDRGRRAPRTAAWRRTLKQSRPQVTGAYPSGRRAVQQHRIRSLRDRSRSRRKHRVSVPFFGHLLSGSQQHLR